MMKRPFYLLVAVGLVCFSVVWLNPGSTTVHSQEVSEADPSTSDLIVRRAEVFFQLQRAKLQQMESRNRRVPNSVSAADIDNLKLNVELGEKLLEAVQDEQTDARKSAYLVLAKNAVAARESELQRAEQVRQQIAGRFSEEDMEVLKLKVSLAKVNLELGQEAMNGAAEDELRWKVDLLYDEVLRLRSELKQVKGR